MRDIQKISELGEGKKLLFIYSDTCKPCQTVKPLIEEFEKKHPEIEVVAAKMYGRDIKNPEDAIFFQVATLRGITPSFAFIDQNQPVAWFRGGNLTMEQLESYMSQKGELGGKQEVGGECEHSKENITLKQRIRDLEDHISTLKKLNNIQQQ